MVLAAALLLVPIPPTSRLVGSFLDLTHVLIGAALAALLDRVFARTALRMPDLQRALLAGGSAVAALGMVEGLQGLTGRTPSVADALSSAFGAGIALALPRALGGGSGGRGRSPRAWLFVGTSFALFALVAPVRNWIDIFRQQRDRPQLASFETGLELMRWRPSEAAMARSPRHATHGARSLEVDLHAGDYPSIALIKPFRDWRGQDALALDVFLDGEAPLAAVVKVEDQVHGIEPPYQSITRVVLDPGPNRIRLPLVDVAAAPEACTLDLSRVAGVALMAPGLRAPRRLWIDHVRLEADQSRSKRTK